MSYYSFFLSILFCLAIIGSSFAQTLNFTDGFDDGNFTHNPAWTGDESLFTIVTVTGNNMLRLDGNEGDQPAHLSTPSTNTTGAWEFYIKFDGFEPSGSNRATIFLMSDQANLKGSVNGYAIEVGEGGDDFFKLVRYDNGAASVILADTTVIKNNEIGYRVKVSRSTAGKWRLEVGKGYTGRLNSSGQTVVDNTYSSSAYFGVLVDYTSTRADKFFFDFKIELPPFAVTDVSLSGDHSVKIAFNRAYNPASVSVNDFFLDNGLPQPISFDPIAVDTLQIAFTEALSSNKYNLEITGISDLEGNQLQPTVRNFIVFGDYIPGDIKFSEFMYDPPTGLPEYVEIANTSDKYLNLINWNIGDNSNIESLQTGLVVLYPHGFLVISSDTAALNASFGAGIYLEHDLPSFNNNGDAIRLTTDTGIMVDSLSYTPDWGGEGVALERRSTATPSSFRENWGESPNKSGTPGASNEVAPDQQAPALTDLSVLDSSTLRLIFSERITAATATDFASYKLTPPRNIQLISIHADTVTLFLNNDLKSGETYTLTVSNIADIFGNMLHSATENIQYFKINDAQQGDIVINEFLFNPASGSAEFIELHNLTNKNFDLSNWYIGDGSSKISMGEHVLLKANGYLVLTENSTFADAIDNSITLASFPALNNGGDAIYLQNTTEVTIDSLHYASLWGTRTGRSLERKDPLAASNDASNWKENASGNSAGLKNSNFEPDEEAPEVIFSKALPNGEIEVHFSEFIQLTNDVQFLRNGRALSISSFDPANANVITLQSPAAKYKTSAAKITVRNLGDVKGNRTPSSEIAIAQPVRPLDLVINEIMFNPLNDTDDNRVDQSEYIELRNTRNYALSLEGLVLHDAPDEDDNLRMVYPVSTAAKWVPSNGVVLIYADEASVFEQSNIAGFFDIKSPEKRSLIHVDRSGLSLSSTADAIFIADSSGATIDSTYYDESWHNPNLIDTKGIALERISPEGGSNNKSNWGSSVHPKGGTPNTENSIYQKNTEPKNKVGISFSPNPFSPDDDGHEDNLFINYTLDHPDYLLKVSIYDRYGRFIKELADSKPAGFEGALIWDGRKGNGSRNRIGIYIVVFEAYNSATGENKAFKEVVVLARRLN